jgi:hypothetical protein
MFRLIQPAHAAELDSPREFIMLVDQSRSVAGASERQALARQTTLAVVRQLRSFAQEDDSLSLIFFGATPKAALETAQLLDASLEARIQDAFSDSTSLGGTAIAEALDGLLGQEPPATVVILITDGVPDTPGLHSPGGPEVYADRLSELGTRHAHRGTMLVILLIGEAGWEAWLPVWKDLAATTQGILVEIQSAADIEAAAQMLNRLAPIGNPAIVSTPEEVTAAAPSPTPHPTARPTHTTSPPRNAAGTETQTARREPSWLPAVIWAGIATAIVALIIFIRLSRASSKPAVSVADGDEGVLEVCDPQTGDMQRIELRDLELGEVRGIGNKPDCRIRLGREPGDEEYAVLVLTPDGPLIESRGAPMWFDDHAITRHLLFDGDDVYLGRFVLGYQNFFRRRQVTGSDPEETRP